MVPADLTNLYNITHPDIVIANPASRNARIDGSRPARPVSKGRPKIPPPIEVPTIIRDIEKIKRF